jgi:hypothetical protein
MGTKTSLITDYEIFINLLLDWIAFFYLLVVFRVRIKVRSLLFIKYRAFLISELDAGE